MQALKVVVPSQDRSPPTRSFEHSTTKLAPLEVKVVPFAAGHKSVGDGVAAARVVVFVLAEDEEDLVVEVTSRTALGTCFEVTGEASTRVVKGTRSRFTSSAVESVSGRCIVEGKVEA